MFAFKFLCSLLSCCLCLSQDGPIIETVYGSIEGTTQQNDLGFFYEEYLGVPYASPPVGGLRWEKPLPPNTWEGVRDAKEFGDHCTQFTVLWFSDYGVHNRTSEDCLYLNVWVPGMNREGDYLAVMVYIHGGGFYSGTGAIYPLEDLAIHGDVIIISINYRLAGLGFMSTEDDAAPGNYGLWDAQMALQWVRENIAAFGGDPDNVTVFGYSAGGSITSHLAISPYTKGLMHRAMPLSGQSAGYYGIALPGSPAKSAQALAVKLGCGRFVNNTAAMVDCMRGCDADEINFWSMFGTMIFRQQLPNMIPVIDGDFVPQNPELSWAGGAASDIDLLIGRAEHDSQGYVTGNGDGSPEDLLNVANSTESLELYFSVATQHFPQGEAGVDAIFACYPQLLADDLDSRTRETVRATTHWWFATYAHVEAKEHARTKASSKNTYLYNFKYRPSFLQYPHEWVTGSHTDEYYAYLGYNHKNWFRAEVVGADFNEDDFYVSDAEMTYFTNFAKSGDPNVGGPVVASWPQYAGDGSDYMEISATPTARPETPEDLELFHFWQQEFPDIVNPDTYDRNEGRDEVELEYEEEDFDEEDVYEALESFRDQLASDPSLPPEELDRINNLIDIYVEKRRQRQLEQYDIYGGM